MRTRVKICGLKRPEDVDAAVAHGADAVGFVFVPGTPRAIDVGLASELRKRVPPFITVVGLFVNAPVGQVLGTVAEAGLDAVQLHGEESVETSAACQRSVRVLKAFRMRGEETLGSLPGYGGAADAFLVDAWVAGAHGGTGARFDWELAVRARALGKPLVLAGGLNPENAGEAIRRVRPFALDVSSGVESAPGVKSAERIRCFLEAVRAADAAIT